MKKFFIASCAIVLFLHANAQKMGTVMDIRDGQVYKTVEIGNKIWMAQNLNFQTRGSWCYLNEDDNCRKFGRIYTWNAVMDGQTQDKAQGICPDGWHVPTDDDWLALTTEYNKSKDLFEGGVSGFNMPLAGCRFPDGKFDFMGKVATYWTSTIDSSNSKFVFTRYAYSDSKSKPLTSYSTNKTYGQYLRCIKN